MYEFDIAFDYEKSAKNNLNIEKWAFEWLTLFVLPPVDKFALSVSLSAYSQLC